MAAGRQAAHQPSRGDRRRARPRRGRGRRRRLRRRLRALLRRRALLLRLVAAPRLLHGVPAVPASVVLGGRLAVPAGGLAEDRVVRQHPRRRAAPQVVVVRARRVLRVRRRRPHAVLDRLRNRLRDRARGWRRLGRLLGESGRRAQRRGHCARVNSIAGSERRPSRRGALRTRAPERRFRCRVVLSAPPRPSAAPLATPSLRCDFFVIELSNHSPRPHTPTRAPQVLALLPSPVTSRSPPTVRPPSATLVAGRRGGAPSTTARRALRRAGGTG